MRVLIIKTSSMGDVIHTLPALTDAGKIIPDIEFDWVVEENFAEIPAWHPRVKKIFPVALRRWRKNIFSSATRKEWLGFYRELSAQKYDFIIDAQGLLKSAWLTFLAKGTRCGGDWNSAREALASLFYQRKCIVSQNQHAVVRMRSLFSQALGYEIPQQEVDYGIDRQAFSHSAAKENYVIFLHGTTWNTKHWPEEYWIELGKYINQAGYSIKLPWSNDSEKERVQRIAEQCEKTEILSKLDLAGIAALLANAKAIVAVDTGLGHLAAALNVPTISLFGPTNPVLTGALGKSQIHLTATFPCSPCLGRQCTYAAASSLFPPCFSTLTPAMVWAELAGLL